MDKDIRWLTAKDASNIVPFDVQTIKKCCNKTEVVEGELPPLSAKRDNRNRWIIRSDDLETWMGQILDSSTRQKTMRGK